MQNGIAILAFVLVKVYDVWVCYILIALLSMRIGYTRARQKTQKIRKKAKKLALPRLAAALVDFQKIQRYFMLAV